METDESLSQIRNLRRLWAPAGESCVLMQTGSSGKGLSMQKVPEVEMNRLQETQYTPTWSNRIRQMGVISAAIPTTHFTEFPGGPARGCEASARGCHVHGPPSLDVCDCVA